MRLFFIKNRTLIVYFYYSANVSESNEIYIESTKMSIECAECFHFSSQSNFHGHRMKRVHTLQLHVIFQTIEK